MEDSKPQMNGSLLSTEKQDILVAPAQEPIASPGPGTSDLENPTTSSFATSTLSTDTKNSSTATFAPEPLIEHSTAGTSKTIPEAPIPENTTTQATPSAENIESIAPPASQPSTTVMSAEKAPAAETVAKPVESNGAPKETKQQAPKSKDQKQNAPATTDGAASSEKLSPAELKRRAKAEKAARRAAAKESSANTIANTGHQTATPGKKGGQKEQGNTGEGAGKHKRSNSTSGTKQAPVKPAGNPPAEVLKKDEFSDKDVTIFSHLYNQGRRDTIAGANKDVHPAVLTLGLQIRDYVICGSNARCVATLLAFKRVVESYVTPPGTSLARNLTTHLSHQISYLSGCRLLSVSQGAAIRALKLVVASIDPAVPENQAKEEICSFIDNFIRERITIADQVIAESAAQKINDGDVILTYAKSSIVQQALTLAFSQGKKFTVYVIDSRPLHEGKALARALTKSCPGLDIRYSLVHAIGHATRIATKVFLGAHAMMSNGRLYSRVGTAQVAMMAKERSIPVIVCCETIKCSDRVALDSIVQNELASADELVEPPSMGQHCLTNVTTYAAEVEAANNKAGKKKGAQKKKDAEEEEEEVKEGQNPLANWKEVKNLQLLNLFYDLTPAEYVSMVITELGSLPPSAVPVVHRMGNSQGV